MANPSVAVDVLKNFWNSQVQDEQSWALNVKILRAVGIFAGSIVVFRNFGDLMAI